MVILDVFRDCDRFWDDLMFCRRRHRDCDDRRCRRDHNCDCNECLVDVIMIVTVIAIIVRMVNSFHECFFTALLFLFMGTILIYINRRM